MVQCLFKTLPDEPGIHEKKLFEEVFGCEVTNWMWKHSDVLLPFVHHWNILWNSSSSSKIYFWSSSSSSKYHSSRYGFELISFTVQFDEQESSTFEVSWNIFLASSSSSSSKIYFWSSSSSSKYHSSRYGFELISFTVQFDEQESSTFEVSWNIFLASSSSCFPCLKSTSNNRVLVHCNILEWNAEIQIASGRSSRTNGRITVTARIEAMLALCVQKTVWCFSVLWSFQQTSRQHVWDAIHVSSEICANFVRIESTL